MIDLSHRIHVTGIFTYMWMISMVNVGIFFFPRTCLSSIFGFEPSKRRPFRFKTGVIWDPGMYIYIYTIHEYYWRPGASLPTFLNRFCFTHPKAWFQTVHILYPGKEQRCKQKTQQKRHKHNWMVVSNIIYVHPYLWK